MMTTISQYVTAPQSSQRRAVIDVLEPRVYRRIDRRLRWYFPSQEDRRQEASLLTIQLVDHASKPATSGRFRGQSVFGHLVDSGQPEPYWNAVLFDQPRRAVMYQLLKERLTQLVAQSPRLSQEMAFYDSIRERLKALADAGVVERKRRPAGWEWHRSSGMGTISLSEIGQHLVLDGHSAIAQRPHGNHTLRGRWEQNADALVLAILTMADRRLSMTELMRLLGEWFVPEDVVAEIQDAPSAREAELARSCLKAFKDSSEADHGLLLYAGRRLDLEELIGLFPQFKDKGSRSRSMRAACQRLLDAAGLVQDGVPFDATPKQLAARFIDLVLVSLQRQHQGEPGYLSAPDGTQGAADPRALFGEAAADLDRLFVPELLPASEAAALAPLIQLAQAGLQHDPLEQFLYHAWLVEPDS